MQTKCETSSRSSFDKLLCSKHFWIWASWQALDCTDKIETSSTSDCYLYWNLSKSFISENTEVAITTFLCKTKKHRFCYALQGPANCFVLEYNKLTRFFSASFTFLVEGIHSVQCLSTPLQTNIWYLLFRTCNRLCFQMQRLKNINA